MRRFDRRVVEDKLKRVFDFSVFILAGWKRPMFGIFRKSIAICLRCRPNSGSGFALILGHE